MFGFRDSAPRRRGGSRRGGAPPGGTARARRGMAAAAAAAETAAVAAEDGGGAAPCAGAARAARLPLSRVKALVKADPDVSLASQEAVFVLARAAVRSGAGPGRAVRSVPFRSVPSVRRGALCPAGAVRGDHR